VYDQDVDLEANEFRSQGGKAFLPPIRLPLLDDEVFPFHVPQLYKPLPESSHPELEGPIRRAHREKTYPVNFPRLLRFGWKAKSPEHSAQSKTKDFFLIRFLLHFGLASAFVLVILFTPSLPLLQFYEQGTCRSHSITLDLNKMLN